MSEDEDRSADTSSSCCAYCGIAEIDEIKLKECDACDLVRYCSDECQRGHKSEHEEACKERAAELRDELLFKQPESTYLGDCPICCLPLPLDKTKSAISGCCSKVICGGCTFENMRIQISDSQKQRCPFCRERSPSTVEEHKKRIMKRVEANDPDAMVDLGSYEYEKENYSRAFEWYTKAAELGNADAHLKLAVLYGRVEGVEADDKGRRMYHLEEAAIRGHPSARYLLANEEWISGNADRAVRHWIITAVQGDDKPMKPLMHAFKKGLVGKEDFAATLRAHQAAVDATKSEERELGDGYQRFLKEQDD